MSKQPWLIWRNEFQDDVIERIHEIAKSKPLKQAVTGEMPRPVVNPRKSQVTWLSREYWLRNILWEYVSEANRRAFGVDVTNYADMQYTEYLGANKGEYDWHIDTDWNNTMMFDRKLSVTLQLSDAADYEGGDFEFQSVETPTDSKGKGTLLIFPSYLRHRVAPVTKGKRYSLVAWFEGPAWR